MPHYLPLGEAFADAYAHVFLNSPCHHSFRNKATGREECERRMDEHTVPLARAMWESASNHDSPQALRHFVWNFFKSVGEEKTKRALVFSTAGIFRDFQSKNYSLASFAARNDEFTSQRNMYIGRFGLAKQALLMMCQSEVGAEVCKEKESFIGQEPTRLLSDLDINSPTAIGKVGRSLAANSASATLVAFDYSIQKGWTMVLQTQSGKAISAHCESSFDESTADGLRVWLECVGESVRILWSSRGELQVSEASHVPH